MVTIPALVVGIITGMIAGINMMRARELLR
jgi:hypothetical protein